MKWNLGHTLVAINMAIVVIIYGGAASHWDNGSAVLMTLIQIGIDLLIAVAIAIDYFLIRPTTSDLKGALKGAWLSVGLVPLVSFGACLAVVPIRIE